VTASSSGITFSVPYEIAVVRPLRQTSLSEREAALKTSGYNTELLPQELIYIDLKTDSGVSSLSTAQLVRLTGAAPLESGIEMAAQGSKALGSLSESFRRFFGFPFMVPVAQGRAAERLWAKLHVKPGSVVPGNMLFPSTRFHIESNGGKVLDVISDAAHDLYSEELFKGNVDLRKLEAAVKENGADKIACVWIELCVNSCGGHPVSLANLKAVKDMLAALKIPLFLDACRILENSYLIKQREPGYQDHSIQEIVGETCALADGATFSAMKDFLAWTGGFIGMREEASYQKSYVQAFLDGSQLASAAMATIGAAWEEIFAHDTYVASRVEQVHYLWRRLKEGIPIVRPAGGHGVFIDARNFLPHVAPDHHPAEALAAFIYHVSGIRVTKGPPLASSQTARGIELLRLAIPARRYVQGHMDDVAEAIIYAHAMRNEIKGLKKLEPTSGAKYDPASFTPL
jgi:tyrosine phenol-lyase